jgi:NADH-quinone oxidoreductase subunit N
MWWRVVAVLATIMIVCGTIASLRTKNLEHLLGFSTLAQIGTVLFALVAANEAALTAISYYAATYLFILTGAYAVLVVLRRGIGASQQNQEDLYEFRGLRQRSPLVAFLLFVFLLALCGLPPTAGFFGRYFIFRALLETGHRYLAWFFVASALPLAYSYLRVAAHLWRVEPQQKSPQLTLGIPEAIVLGVCVFVSLAAGLYSEPFMRVARYAFGQ